MTPTPNPIRTTHTAASTPAGVALARPLLAAALSLAALSAQASCGSATCSLMTDRFAQTGADLHGGLSVDVRLEQLTQSRLRSGTTTLSPSDVTDEEAIETRTRNTLLVTTLSYGLHDGWSVGLRLPVGRRDHLHDTFDTVNQVVTGSERWTFTRLGDVQLQARRQFPLADAGASLAVFGGLKLPTGGFNVVNADGTPAERALQPGTGTTDLTIGLAWRQAVGVSDAAFAQTDVASALAARRGYKPGTRFEASVGWSHAYSPAVGTVVQLNLRQRGRDSGGESEPANSGSTSVDLSPGLTLAAGAGTTVYGFLQLPVYQKVNGIQLVPSHSLAVGLTHDF